MTQPRPASSDILQAATGTNGAPWNAHHQTIHCVVLSRQLRLSSGQRTQRCLSGPLHAVISSFIQKTATVAEDTVRLLLKPIRTAEGGLMS